jgi:DUF1680 family protein
MHTSRHSLSRAFILDAVNNRLTRREFVSRASAAVLVGTASTLSGAADPPQRQPLEEFDYARVRLTAGPFKQHYDRILDSYLALDNDRLLKVYRQRAGLPAPGAPMGGWYDADGFVPGHSLGQYISGLARFGRATGNMACYTKVAELVDGFSATLGTDNCIYAGENAEKVWPCYVLDKHLAGLIDAFNLSGVTRARELVTRVFHGALASIPASGHDRVGKENPPYDETYVLPETLFAAHALTGDQAMLDRARAYLLDRDFFDPLARGEDVLPGRHAYSHAIALSSAAAAYRTLGDDKYLRAMKHAWELLTATQQYATGGWGPNETFITPHKGELYSSLNSTDDHFETLCGSYAAIKLARYLLCLTGDAHYGDGLERLIYNTTLAVKYPDGDGNYPYYSTYGPNARKVFYAKKWPCCSGTLVECVADYPKNIYLESADGIAINLYAPSELRWTHAGTSIHLSQQTDYPLAESIAVRVECANPVEFALRLRIPDWLRSPVTIRVNGEHAHPELRRGFAILRRTWRTGDSIDLTLPMQFRTEPIDDAHPETVAILRGPLVYVEQDPAPHASQLPRLGGLKASAAGIFAEHTPERERTCVPFYFVTGQRYTTYFQTS